MKKILKNVVATAPLTIGGQAVIEGVMMKSPHFVTTAVRKEDGRIIHRTRRANSWTEKLRVNKIPFLRGMIVLLETMILGLKELAYSANEALNEEDNKYGNEKNKNEKKKEKGRIIENKINKKGDLRLKTNKETNKEINKELSTSELIITLIISIGMTIILFKVIPLLVANYFSKNNNTLLNIIDGITKITIFTIYLWLIGLMKDVKRLYEYHGAEHKTVNAYEDLKDENRLNPELAIKYSKAQPRCGTTFIIYVLVLSILFYFLIPAKSTLLEKLLLRIALLPIIAGVAYEIIRATGKHYSKSRLLRIMLAPGMFFQRLTTKEPDKEELEVGIKALQEVIKAEKRLEKLKKINRQREQRLREEQDKDDEKNNGKEERGSDRSKKIIKDGKNNDAHKKNSGNRSNNSEKPKNRREYKNKKTGESRKEKRKNNYHKKNNSQQRRVVNRRKERRSPAGEKKSNNRSQGTNKKKRREKKDYRRRR